MPSIIEMSRNPNGAAAEETEDSLIVAMSRDPNARNEQVFTAYRNSVRLEDTRRRDLIQGDDPLRRVGLAVGDVLPFVRSIASMVRESEYSSAQERMRAGNPTDDDLLTISRHERRQQERAERTRSLGGSFWDTASHLPGMAFEFLTAGRALGAVAGSGVTGTAWLARTAPTMRAALTSPASYGRTAALTALTPSFYAEEWQRRNLEAGRPSLHPYGLPVPLALGMLQNAIVGSLGSQMRHLIPGEGVSYGARRLASGVGVGIGEQQVADLVMTMIGQQPHHQWGIIGQLIRGEGQEALKNAASQALTFAAFGLMHEARPPIMNNFARAVDSVRARSGLSYNSAAQQVKVVGDRIEMAIGEGRNRRELAEVVKEFPEGPLRDYARSLSEAVPDLPMSGRERQPSLSDLAGQASREGVEGLYGPPRPEPQAERPAEALPGRAGPASLEGYRTFQEVQAQRRRGQARPEPTAEEVANVFRALIEGEVPTRPTQTAPPVQAPSGQAPAPPTLPPPVIPTPSPRVQRMRRRQTPVEAPPEPPAPAPEAPPDPLRRRQYENPVDYAKRILAEAPDPINEADLRAAGIPQVQAKTILDMLVKQGHAKREGSFFVPSRWKPKIESTRDILNHIDRFPEMSANERRAIEQLAMGRKMREIGHEMGMSPEGVRQAAQRALKIMGVDKSVQMMFKQESEGKPGAARATAERTDAAQQAADPAAVAARAEEAPAGVRFSEQPGEYTGAGAGRGGPGLAEIRATQEALFNDAKVYLEKTLPYNQLKQAVAELDRAATFIKREAAQDPLVSIEEIFHHLSRVHGLETEPARLPADVALGLRDFFYPHAEMSPRTMDEGFAHYVRRRMMGQLDNLTPEQQAARQWADKWIKDNGLEPALARIQDLYRQFQSQTPVEKAGGLLSPTGQPAEPILTTAEQAKGAWQRVTEWWQDNITNRLGVLDRIEADMKRQGHSTASIRRAKEVYSQLMNADKHVAAEFERDGMWTIVDGKKTRVGLSWAQVTEGAKPEWLEPIKGLTSWEQLKSLWQEPTKVTRAGLFAMTRHILDEHAHGREVVPEEQRRMYEEAMREFEQDPEFVEWATGFHNRLTQGVFNASLRVLASPDVHRISPAAQKAMEEARETYLPTSRVVEGQEFGKEFLTRRSGPSGEQIVDPLVSAKKRIQLTAHMLMEQIKDNVIADLLMQDGAGRYGVPFETPREVVPRQHEKYLTELGFADHEVAAIIRAFGTKPEHAPWPKDGRNATWYWHGPDGKLTSFRIGDRALYDLITSQQGDNSNTIKLFRAMGQWAPFRLMNELTRRGATTFNLGFQFRNLFRDAHTYLSNTSDMASAKQLPEALGRAVRFEWNTLMGQMPKDVLFKLFADYRGEGMREFDFDQSAPTAPGQQPTRIRSAAEFVKQVFRLAGAGELGPRFLEFRNRLKELKYTEEQIIRDMEQAEQAAAEGKPWQEPLKFFDVISGMHAAGEVTTPFHRKGILTDEINKIIPFFGPAVAGTSKFLRNVKENPKGAMVGLAALLAARYLHWQLTHDEDWYPELSANDRFNNFVVPFNGGLYRLPGQRGLDVPIGGFLVTMLDLANNQNPDFAGLVQQSLGAVMPPGLDRPSQELARGDIAGATVQGIGGMLGPVGTTAVDVARNRSWMGTPIVPRRDEPMSAGHNLTEHQLPYAAQQLTGGRMPTSYSGLGLVPFSEVRNANRSVDEYFERLGALEAERTLARRQGLAFDQESEYQRLHAVESRIRQLSLEASGLRRTARGMQQGERPSEERRAEIRRQQVALARQALQAVRR